MELLAKDQHKNFLLVANAINNWHMSDVVQLPLHLFLALQHLK